MPVCAAPQKRAKITGHIHAAGTSSLPGITERRITMGKGDRKTAKGKRYSSSYGNARSAKAVTKSAGTTAAPVAKKAAAKKVVAKKAAAKA